MVSDFWLLVPALAALVESIRANYWKNKYQELRNDPVIREVARQLLTEEEVIDERRNQK